MAYRNPQNRAMIAEIIARNGPLRHAQQVPAEIVAIYEGRVPGLILDFWENHGIGELGDGLLKLCVPEMFAGPLAVLLDGDPDFAGRTVALAYGPFGNLLLWNEDHWLGLLSHPGAMIDAPFFGKDVSGLDPDRILFDYVLGNDLHFMDVFDDDGSEMYGRARAEMGELHPGLIYGLMPADSFADVGLAQLRVVVAEEWMTERFLGQVYMLQDLMGDRLNLRRIGAPS